MTRALRAVLLQTGTGGSAVCSSVTRQCTGKLPGYRTQRTRFGDSVGASRLSPLARLGPATLGLAPDPAHRETHEA